MSVEAPTVCADQNADEKEAATTEPVEEAAIGNKKSCRQRMRHHYNDIRALMEFYFGDANLSKDRFLRKIVDKDPFVPLETFLTLNKMKNLCTSTTELAKSLSNSELLELDETQQKVRRKVPIPVERDVDHKTLYVESLPQNADHEWVKQIFSRFGKVEYVSLPKYAKSRKIKEFGFIEFEKEESIAKAVQAFQQFNGVLSMEETDPAELKSVKAFVKEKKEEENSSAAAVDATNARKIKRRISEAAESESSDIKKPKLEDETSATEAETEETAESDNKDKEPEKSGAEAAQKKHRKRKKKSKHMQMVLGNEEASFYELKILPKRDWKRLRNKYLNLQRELVGELKRKAYRATLKQQQQSSENIAEHADKNNVNGGAAAAKLKERRLQKINMNFYGAGDADANETTPKAADEKQQENKANPAVELAPLFNYEPGLIVEVTFLQPCVEVKEFKADMRQYSTVKYVDVKEGVTQAHLRLESANAAEEFVRQVSCAEYNCKVLCGEPEQEYWKKIEQDRAMKFNKQVKVKPKRGREKVKKLVAKHIRFGDEDEEP